MSTRTMLEVLDEVECRRFLAEQVTSEGDGAS
jgi:hypothetical protein